MRIVLRGLPGVGKTTIARGCLQAIVADEWTLFKKHGKRLKGSRIWRSSSRSAAL
jgi:broad-specificity NMP kinase